MSNTRNLSDLARDINLKEFGETFTLPTTDGSSGQVLSTNGSGGLSWIDSGGGGFNYVYTSANTYTATSNDYIAADSSNNAIVITLPASPSTYDIVTVIDYNNSFSTNNVTIDRNGSTIEGTAANTTISFSNREYTFLYLNSDWKIYSKEALGGITSERYLTGPTTGNEVTEINLNISGWQVGDTYTISVTGGDYRQINDLVIWTLPAVSTDTVHTMTLTLVGGGTYEHDAYVVNIPTTTDTSISITDFSLNSFNDGWTIS